MAELVFTHNISTKRRRTGGSAACGAAYCLRSKATDPWSGRTVNHSARHKDVLFSVLVGPDGILAQDPIAHFTKVDERETHKWAWVAREGIGSLPSLLNLEQQKDLALTWALWLAKRYRAVVLVVIHRAPPQGDPRNVHMHYLMGTRNRNGAKLRVLDKVTTSKPELIKLRREFADKTNEALCMAGFQDHVDPRSYAERGLDQVPGRHRGQRRTRLERIADENHDKQCIATAQLHVPNTLIADLASRSPTDLEINAIIMAADLLRQLNQPNDYAREFLTMLGLLVAREHPDSDTSVVAADLLQTHGEAAAVPAPPARDADVIATITAIPELPVSDTYLPKTQENTAIPPPAIDVPSNEATVVLFEPPHKKTPTVSASVYNSHPPKAAAEASPEIEATTTRATDLPIPDPTPYRSPVNTRATTKPKVAKATAGKPPVAPRVPSIELFVPMIELNYSEDGGPLTDDDRAKIKKARALLAEGKASASAIYQTRLEMAERRSKSGPTIAPRASGLREPGFE